MSRKASITSVTWGDTPLGRIASTSLSDLPLAEMNSSRSSPVTVSQTPYRKQMSYSPSATRRGYQKGKYFRRHSSASILKSTPHFLDDLEKRRLSIRTISDFGSDIGFDDISEAASEERMSMKDDKESNSCSAIVFRIQLNLKDFVTRHQTVLKRTLKILFLLLYLTYFTYAMYFKFGDEGSIRLLVCSVLAFLLIFFYNLPQYMRNGLDVLCLWHEKPVIAKAVRWVFYILAVLTVLITLIVLVVIKNPRNLLSLPGLVVFVVITFITSSNPSKVTWHPVFWGVTSQYLVGVVVLYTEWGEGVCRYVGDRVVELLHYSDEGALYVFGDTLEIHRFAFSTLAVTIFFSTFVSLLYHLGVMQAVLRLIGRSLAFCLHASPIEALNVVGNIFIGFIEAPLLIRPFIPVMTKSELHTVMTAGFATTAGSMLTVYAQFGIPTHHLLAACFMSAPAALAVSKLSCPETAGEAKATFDDYVRLEDRTTDNLIDSVTSGATGAIKLVAMVTVNVLAFLSVFKLISASLTWFGDRVGVEELTFEFICSYLFYPLALFMGVDVSDCQRVAALLGVKIFTNELSAYSILNENINNREMFENYTISYNFTDWRETENRDIELPSWNTTLHGGILSERSEVIASYALCGFSNIGSIGIMLGVLGGLAPHRKHVLTKIVIRAFVAGNIACFMTACTAGLLHKST